ncbi:hypothetical protein CC117_05750 [Parafrankia colletiae]|uniref:Uncharacterized protein n=1 Tax=Parafrankia colletiae TaxID=573497 RepID=A0A1S1QEJ6_9ACTN|nr:hypothetical protein CC117_05750 [Parafrankia colletiae]
MVVKLLVPLYQNRVIDDSEPAPPKAADPAPGRTAVSGGQRSSGPGALPRGHNSTLVGSGSDRSLFSLDQHIHGFAGVAPATTSHVPPL